MQMLPSKTSSTAEKATGWGIILVIAALIFWGWGSIVEFVALTLKNTLLAFVYSVILVVGGFTLYYNWHRIFTGLLTLFIKSDPLSFMDRYADILTNKLKNLRAAIINLKGTKHELEAQMAEDSKIFKDNMNWAAAAKQQGKEARATGFVMEAQGAKESIELYKPSLERINKSLKFMEPMAEDWEISIDGMRSMIKRKRRDWKTIKATHAALKQSEDYLMENTTEGRIFKQSLDEYQSQISQKIAFIDDFEQRAKPILEGVQIKQVANQQDALKALEEYMSSSNKLALPKFDGEILEYQMVPQSASKYTFKNKKP